MNTQVNSKSDMLEMISTIHKVEGFDPSALAVEYTDLNTAEIRKRLPVMAQIAWFRLAYPEGKISVTATIVKDHYVAHAKVYHHFEDAIDCFLAEATATRKHDPEKPTVSPREWAQTAAIGIALRNAGFGLLFYAAGDAFDQLAVDETGGLVEPQMANIPEEPRIAELGKSDTTPMEPPLVPHEETRSEELSQEDAFQQALETPCPIQKYAGKTLGNLLKEGENNALIWVANKYTKDPAVAAAAKLICERALECSA